MEKRYVCFFLAVHSTNTKVWNNCPKDLVYNPMRSRCEKPEEVLECEALSERFASNALQCSFRPCTCGRSARANTQRHARRFLRSHAADFRLSYSHVDMVGELLQGSTRHRKEGNQVVTQCSTSLVFPNEQLSRFSPFAQRLVK